MLVRAVYYDDKVKKEKHTIQLRVCGEVENKEKTSGWWKSLPLNLFPASDVYNRQEQQETFFKEACVAAIKHAIRSESTRAPWMLADVQLKGDYFLYVARFLPGKKDNEFVLLGFLTDKTDSAPIHVEISFIKTPELGPLEAVRQAWREVRSTSSYELTIESIEKDSFRPKEYGENKLKVWIDSQKLLSIPQFSSAGGGAAAASPPPRHSHQRAATMMASPAAVVVAPAVVSPPTHHRGASVSPAATPVSGRRGSISSPSILSEFFASPEREKERLDLLKREQQAKLDRVAAEIKATEEKKAEDERKLAETSQALEACREGILKIRDAMSQKKQGLKNNEIKQIMGKSKFNFKDENLVMSKNHDQIKNLWKILQQYPLPTDVAQISKVMQDISQFGLESLECQRLFLVGCDQYIEEVQAAKLKNDQRKAEEKREQDAIEQCNLKITERIDYLREFFAVVNEIMKENSSKCQSLVGILSIREPIIFDIGFLNLQVDKIIEIAQKKSEPETSQSVEARLEVLKETVQSITDEAVQLMEKSGGYVAQLEVLFNQKIAADKRAVENEKIIILGKLSDSYFDKEIKKYVEAKIKKIIGNITAEAEQLRSVDFLSEMVKLKKDVDALMQFKKDAYAVKKAADAKSHSNAAAIGRLGAVRGAVAGGGLSPSSPAPLPQAGEGRTHR